MTPAPPQALVQTLVWVQQQHQIRNLGSRSVIPAVAQTASTSTPSPSSTTMSGQNNNNNSGTSSPLLFFVALGFGVVFTNLWIIVGVKYCFRYNARNRAIRNGEDPDPIGLDNMPARPHRRRREKKLMTMDDVNERFPLTKYKNWVMSRASEGLPTEGGVTAPPSRAGSVRNVDGALKSVPLQSNQTPEDAQAAPAPAANAKVEANSKEVNGVAEEKNSLEHVQTTASTVDKHATRTSEDEDDEDDHIHTAVPPELLTNPGDSCAICIDTLEDDDDIRGLTCGHAFHAGCLDPWLTSRRACCPLCKADYYVPKPRPEGEAAEGERSSRRGNRMPVAPPPAWTGMRAARGLPGRFMSGHPGDAYNTSPRPGRRRAQQAAAEQAAAAARPPVPGEASVDGAAGSVPNTSRWRPRNPFSNIHMPSLPGRNRQQAPNQSNIEPSPSQLEAGRPPVV